MGDRLATIDMGRKLGIWPPFLGGEGWPHLTQCRLGRGLPCEMVRKFGHNGHSQKSGAVPLLGELGPHLTQCGRARGLPVRQVSSWFVQPFGRTGQWSHSIGRTVLQTVAQKLLTSVIHRATITEFLHTIYMPAVHPPRCRESSNKCLLFWHHFLNNIVIIWTFS